MGGNKRLKPHKPKKVRITLREYLRYPIASKCNDAKSTKSTNTKSITAMDGRSSYIAKIGVRHNNAQHSLTK